MILERLRRYGYDGEDHDPEGARGRFLTPEPGELLADRGHGDLDDPRLSPISGRGAVGLVGLGMYGFSWWAILRARRRERARERNGAR